MVIGLWKGETCVATSHLTPTGAARLGVFITNGPSSTEPESTFSQNGAPR